jgi:hypothetical protein
MFSSIKLVVFHMIFIHFPSPIQNFMFVRNPTSAGQIFIFGPHWKINISFSNKHYWCQSYLFSYIYTLSCGDSHFGHPIDTKITHFGQDHYSHVWFITIVLNILGIKSYVKLAMQWWPPWISNLHRQTKFYETIQSQIQWFCVDWKSKMATTIGIVWYMLWHNHLKANLAEMFIVIFIHFPIYWNDAFGRRAIVIVYVSTVIQAVDEDSR